MALVSMDNTCDTNLHGQHLQRLDGANKMAIFGILTLIMPQRSASYGKMLAKETG